MIITRDPITQTEGYCLPVSRAATALYCVLKQHSRANEYVLVPANLCYAGIFPIEYAEMRPLFCDVDPYSGNVTVQTVSNAIQNVKPVAMIIPHMYGNPVKDLPEIADLCKKSNILLIEDCASAMGAESEDYRTGCIGDYTVYSTGYSKTLDLGFGGFLVSHLHYLKEEEKTEQTLGLLTEEAKQEMRFWSPMYRLIRNNGGGTAIVRSIYQNLGSCLRNSFLYWISEEQKTELITSLQQLPETIQKRRDALEEYRRHLNENMQYHLYPYTHRSVPWRLNILVDNPEMRKQIIRNCLSEHLPVSDWYPVVTPIFGDTGHFLGAEAHEKKIINFPLLNSTEEKKQICEVINCTISHNN